MGKHQNVTFIIKMKFSTILTLVGAAVASPVIEERQETIDPLSASLAVFNALPTSLRDMALTNPAAVVSAIASDSATGSAASEASEAASSASGALSSAAADASAAVSSAAGGLSSLASSASAAASSATSDSGAMPTQVIAGGFAGVAGLMAVLAL